MRLEAEVDANVEALARITAVARRTACPVFGDFLWDPCPHLQTLMSDPGVMFESPHRVVVFQRVGEELRYYAGGWCPDESRRLAEEDRVLAEGHESGVFRSVADALVFAERYLVEERTLAAVGVARDVRYAWYPEVPEAEPPAAPDRGRRQVSADGPGGCAGPGG